MTCTRTPKTSPELHAQRAAVVMDARDGLDMYTIAERHRITPHRVGIILSHQLSPEELASLPWRRRKPPAVASATAPARDLAAGQSEIGAAPRSPDVAPPGASLPQRKGPEGARMSIRRSRGHRRRAGAGGRSPVPAPSSASAELAEAVSQAGQAVRQGRATPALIRVFEYIGIGLAEMVDLPARSTTNDGRKQTDG